MYLIVSVTTKTFNLRCISDGFVLLSGHYGNLYNVLKTHLYLICIMRKSAWLFIDDAPKALELIGKGRKQRKCESGRDFLINK